jgi:hypothetical protein
MLVQHPLDVTMTRGAATPRTAGRGHPPDRRQILLFNAGLNFLGMNAQAMTHRPRAGRVWLNGEEIHSSEFRRRD